MAVVDSLSAGNLCSKSEPSRGDAGPPIFRLLLPYEGGLVGGGAPWFSQLYAPEIELEQHRAEKQDKRGCHSLQGKTITVDWTLGGKQAPVFLVKPSQDRMPGKSFHIWCGLR